MTAVLDPATRALVQLALGLPEGTEAQLGAWIADARRAGTPDLWLDELLISSVVFVGFPRALVAMAELRRLVPGPAEGAEVTDYGRWMEWRARGEATCRAVYGKHYGFLRRNVRALHPALEELDDRRRLRQDAEPSGARPDAARAVFGGDAGRRSGAPRQLLSHLRGALNAGATPEQVDDVLEHRGDAWAVGTDVLAVARDLWQELKATLLHD